MKWYFNSNLLIRILIGLILGAVCGLAFGPAIGWVSPLGDLFVRLLKMIVMPVVIFTLIVGTASISPSRLGKVGVKILIFYMLTSAFAVGIGLIFGNILQPGEGLNLMGAADAAGKELKQPSLIQTLLEIVPKNPFAAITSGKILPTIFASILFGIGLSSIREHKEERVRTAAETLFFNFFFSACSEIMYKVVGWVLQFAPIGVFFALIAVVFGKQGANAFGPLLSVTSAVYIALIVHIVVIYGGILALTKSALRSL